MRVLRILAGPVARRHLRERGLRASDVGVVVGAAAGPKGLALNGLDRFLFGHWLGQGGHVVHLLGASIGAWRFAHACLPDADAALAQLAHDYIHESYAHPDGGWPPAAHVSAVMRRRLESHFAGREAQLLAHPRYRLHAFTSRGCHPWFAPGAAWRTWALYGGALAANTVSRHAMAAFLERVVFSDPRDPLPLALLDYRTQQVPLGQDNLRDAVLASCSIPFWLEPVRDIAGAPAGAYWDGGITDYHLHLDYASMRAATPRSPLVLYPHLQATVVPGWLDKGLRHRHRATARLDNVVLVVPHEEWVRTLPDGKLPDRSDFKRHARQETARVRAWTTAVAESERLGAEFAALVGRDTIEAEPLV
ncbi:MAG: hypothetical protein NW204_14575 [Xanthomonadaceae bacterium]|nr:hypothetical protein [Xanthomonadaceae bacterium]